MCSGFLTFARNDGKTTKILCYAQNDRYDAGKPHPIPLLLGEGILFLKNKNVKIDKNTNL